MSRTVTLVVMGVSGVGKSSVAAELVNVTGWPSLEGDDLHSAGSRELMTAGHPLDDALRAPWLRKIAAWIGAREHAGEDAVLTCSALRRRYRDVLREGHPSVRFVHLTAPPGELERRLGSRTGHFMPASLLASQLETLEPLEPDEPGVTVLAQGDIRLLAEQLVRTLAGTP